MGELQELRVLSKDNVEKIDSLSEDDMPKDFPSTNDSNCQDTNFKFFSSHGNADSAELTIEHLESRNLLIHDAVEDVGLNREEIKPTFEETQASLPEEFEVVPNFFPSMKSNDSESSLTFENDAIDDKSQLAEGLSLTTEKSEVGLEFSPDMFFADAEENSDEPDKKKVCVADLKK
nr:uncharacterized protein LOC111507906 [Leptinotarsa decemlineata]